MFDKHKYKLGVQTIFAGALSTRHCNNTTSTKYVLVITVNFGMSIVMLSWNGWLCYILKGYVGILPGFLSLIAQEVAKLPTSSMTSYEHVGVTGLTVPLLHQNEWSLWNVIRWYHIHDTPCLNHVRWLIWPSHFGYFYSPGRVDSQTWAAWYTHGWD